MSVREREHGAASYNKGCPCSRCLEAKRTSARRRRARSYQSRDRRDGDVMCVVCCCWFDPHGVTRHENICDG